MNLPYFMHKGFRIYSPVVKAAKASVDTCTAAAEEQPAAKPKKSKK